MATNRDKFLELRKSGVDPITARKQSYGEIPAIANAPVAGVAPAITPIAPVAPISNADVLAQNKAKVQGEIQAGTRPPVGVQPIDNKQVLANNQAKVAGEIQAGTRPAVGQQSESLAPPPTGTTTPSGATLNADGTVTNAPPVNATANPTTPAPTATPTTATASNTATGAVDFNVGAGREADISKNLTGFKQQGMDDNAIKQASGYATADATKKAQIDGFLAGQNKPLDEGTVFNAMMAGTPPPIQNTPDYRSAKYRYDQFQKFNGMTVPQLVDNLKQGEITTEMNNLLAQNPNYQLAKQQMQAYQNTQNINNAVNGFSSGINGKEIDTPDYLQALSDKILTKLGLSETSAQQAFKDIVTNDSKVVDYTNQLSAINRQVADTTKLLNDGYKDLKAQYGDMPSSALITLMNSRFSTANDTLANLNNSKSYLEADLKNAVEMARGEYEAAAQDIQQQNTVRNNLISQATQAQFNSLQNKQSFDNSVALKQMDYAESERIRGQEGTTWQSANITRYNPATGANDSTPIFYRKKTNGAGFEAVDLAGNPIDANLLAGGFTPTTSTSTPGTATGGSIDLPRTGNNVGQDANNPGNITVIPGVQAPAGSIGTYKSPNGRSYYVFPDMQTGLSAQANDIKAKQSGNTSTGITGDSTLEQYLKVHVNGPNGGPIGKEYLDRVIKATGLTANTKIGSVDPTLLAKGVAAGEGVDINKNATIPQQSQTPASTAQFNPLQVKEFETYDGKTIPAQYKTPLEQDQFIANYNAWRGARPGVKIENGKDILDIKIDKPTGEQSAAQTYASRMLYASNDLKDYENKYIKLPLKEQVYQTYAPNIAVSEDQKLINTAKENFITAVLRKQSGASISIGEFLKEDKKYFPQPGDSEKVLIAKRNARNFEIKATLNQAGSDETGKSISSYYNPEIETYSAPTETAPTGETPEQRIARLRNQKK